MPVKATLAVLALLVAACGGSADTTSTTDGAAGTTTTGGAAGTTSTAAASETTEAPTSTQVDPTTTQAPPGSGPVFVLSSVTFGDGPMIVITNIGDEDGNLGGHWLCQRPTYWEFPNMDLPAGESVAVSAGGIGGLDPLDGEIGFYNAQSFGSSGAILSYVEWGSSGHGRSPVAVSASIWPDGAFVETTADTTTLIGSDLPATSPDSWAAS